MNLHTSIPAGNDDYNGMAYGMHRFSEAFDYRSTQTNTGEKLQ